MRFYTYPDRARSKAKKLKRALDELGIAMKLTACQKCVAEMYGFDGWKHFLRDCDAVTPSDVDEVSDSNTVFDRRDLQMRVLLKYRVDDAKANAALDKVRPTGALGRSPSERLADDEMWQGFEDVDY